MHDAFGHLRRLPILQSVPTHAEVAAVVDEKCCWDRANAQTRFKNDLWVPSDFFRNVAAKIFLHQRPVIVDADGHNFD